MPELRKDPIIGRWVIVATERAKRPDDFVLPNEESAEGVCPFCEGSERLTPPEIFAIRSSDTEKNLPGWQVRVVPSIKPFLRIEGDLERRGRGIYDLMNSVGAHEVVIETPRHIAGMADLSDEQISKVIATYIGRIKDLEKDVRFKYVLVFKNYGWTAGGGRLKHSRSQIIATPANPKRVKEELVGSKRYFDYHERCVFCDFIKQELERKERLILDLDGFVAISPFAARFPFEIWILPKEHSPDFVNLKPELYIHLGRVMKIILSKLKKGLSDPPYNYVLHTAPFRRAKTGYWTTIEYDYHWHIEIIPRLTRVAGFEWGTGFYICPIQPEKSAEFLRGITI